MIVGLDTPVCRLPEDERYALLVDRVRHHRAQRDVCVVHSHSRRWDAAAVVYRGELLDTARLDGAGCRDGLVIRTRTNRIGQLYVLSAARILAIGDPHDVAYELIDHRVDPPIIGDGD